MVSPVGSQPNLDSLPVSESLADTVPLRESEPVRKFEGVSLANQLATWRGAKGQVKDDSGARSVAVHDEAVGHSAFNIAINLQVDHYFFIGSISIRTS